MNNPFYISSHAANKLLTKQMITTNNLANMSTIGFKAKNVLVINKLNNNSLTKYPNQQYFQSYYDLTEGSFINTKQPLDLIIQNKGWFVVQDKKNFKEYYTRNGHLHVNSDGYLSIQERLILGDKGPIKLPKKTDLKITRNGDILILKKINNKTFEQKISKLKIAKININKMIQDQQGMFYTTKKSVSKNIEYETNNINIKSGELENSNVNSASNIINLISDARLFEMNMKIISNYNEMNQQANKIFNINN